MRPAPATGLAASLDPSFARENWGFLAQHCVENLLEGLIALAYLAGFLVLCGRSV